MIKNLLGLSRKSKKITVFLSDTFIVLFSIFSSFSLRLGSIYIPTKEHIIFILLAPVIAVLFFEKFGLYRVVNRYIDLPIIYSAAKAVSIYSFIWGTMIFLFSIEGVPRSVILINWVISTSLIVGARVFIGLYFNKADQPLNQDKKRVIIYGSGEAGRQLFRSLKASKKFTPIFFVDDDKNLYGTNIFNVEVIPAERIQQNILKYDISEIFLAIPSLEPIRKKEILNSIESYGIPVRLLPSLDKLVSDDIYFEDLKRISLNDLLGRERVSPDKNLLTKNIKNKVVLITGAGGSIGSELSRQISKHGPDKVILYEQNEFALFSIHSELIKNNSNIYPVLGSVNNLNRLIKILTKYKVNVIFHAAAYKHVPMVEHNISEGVMNNVFGTLNCAKAAINAKVDTFVLISSDKAVRPTNIMGATKRVAEIILQNFSNENTPTKFCMVRFGNVLGSSGSVIPLFQDQIKNGGPITLTHKNITRFFMALSEAVELVIQAASLSKGGEIFLLDMGEPVKIYDLAKKMIHLSGKTIKNSENPNGDIEIKIIGLRPGEKLFEELLIDRNAQKTVHPLIIKGSDASEMSQSFSMLISKLEEYLLDNNTKKIIETLSQIVPEYSPSSRVVDFLKN